MKLISESGRTYSIQPIDYVRTNDEVNKSKGHLRARALLKKVFFGEWILEEVPAKLSKSTLYLDFLLPQSKVVVEVQGVQHDKFVEFFHKTQSNFKASLKRDVLKERWCEINGFRLVQLPYSENDELWMSRILNND